MKAAQTGHMVLSTLHTNDSISAVARLLDLGIAEYLIASSVTGILAQRLLRKLCACHTHKQMTPDYSDRLAAVGWLQPPDRIAWPQGCTACDHTGYKGRVGIYELLSIDESIRAVLRGGYKPDLVRTAARAAGMRRMQDDALEKIQAGLTTLEEVVRVVPMEALPSSGCEGCGHELSSSYRFCPYCGTRRGPGASDSPSGSALKVAEGVLS
jgi:type II secretory ATPase GspE/PulE/Tfp pilus assembly ATPase PilB-like protein